MAWVDMRCPKCGEILPDFVDSCYTCDYKFIAKEYDPQTYPDTRKRDKELWKYKYDTEYYGAAEPPVRCGESHLSGLTEPPHFVYLSYRSLYIRFIFGFPDSGRKDGKIVMFCHLMISCV